jgi:hypothetical protein
VRRRRWPAALVAVVVGAVSSAGCATEIDPDIPTAASGSAPATTEFIATGTTAELFERLLAETEALSEAIVDNEGQHRIMHRIDVIWAAVRPDVETADPDHLLEFDRAIVMLHTGVDRRRPADADKAYNNLVQLVNALA